MEPTRFRNKLGVMRGATMVEYALIIIGVMFIAAGASAPLLQATTANVPVHASKKAAVFNFILCLG